MKASTSRPILVAGGARDPNLIRLRDQLEAHGSPVFFVEVGAEAHPALTWDLRSDTLSVNGQAMHPRAAFVRFDVFEHDHDPRPAVARRCAAWYAAVTAFVEAHPEVRSFNSRRQGRPLWKPYVLQQAANAGLAVPDTCVSNHVEDLERFLGSAAKAVKPVDGGGPCRRLGDVLRETETRCGAAASPAIVQPELIGPELRLYGVAGRFIGFSITSDALDYRTASNLSVEPLDQVPGELAGGLGRLMAALDLDFCAADFKTCPVTGALLFLEINDTPMFARFDGTAGGAITDAMRAFFEGDRPPMG